MGYFLAQHKQQLGNKYISKITVFVESETAGSPNMLFWVSDAPPPTEDPDDKGPGGVVRNMALPVMRRSVNLKNILREHIIHAKL
jgi:hypothetical protein